MSDTVRPAHIDPDYCEGRILKFMGHQWVRRAWDKYGTGRRDSTYYACKFCIAFKGMD